ncbi:AAA_5 domain-containing protein [Tenacibaculum sp. 190130A14a]|uniref:McrB family protein n=1 Tax=Tenacibaculum polynesiense TaxID=3137857 RepID=UPI0032B1E279
MIYIREIFKQDLRGGKQIAFPTKPSNNFFNFDYVKPDEDRKISFSFIEDDIHSENNKFNNKLINTRLYAAEGKEARIDSELKSFLIKSLKAEIGDIIVFIRKNDKEFQFKFISSKDKVRYNLLKSLINGYHELPIIDNDRSEKEITIKAINKIFYGAPGTGKSHKVKEIVKGKEERTERVTFHPEYDYSSFIGGYKPTMDGEKIKYEFVPQAFTNVYINAWNDLENDYYLVIEEINRGNCAEIFGDVFQLLDRTNDYKITPSKELKEYLETKLKDNPNIQANKLLLPPNLSILATMNTSDQSLFPMDSAFKRRWDWEYIPINYSRIEDENSSTKFVVKISNGESFKWLDFIEKVNEKISQNHNLGMDKCLGNYFIKPINDVIEIDTFINKAIFYLWNDVFKDEREEESIFKNKVTYEKFFPIDEKNGIQKVKDILDDLEIDYKDSI